MTEMVHGSMPAHVGEPVLSRWWRTVDRWTISSVLLLVAVGLLLALASSPPLAARNHLPPFHYFERHAIYAGLSVTVMLFVSMRNPETIRRWGVLGFGLGFATLLALPVIGTDFGKGAVRWLSLGFTSVQPSEFVKPCLAVTAAWLLAAGQDLNGPPGRLLSLGVVLATVGLLVIQPDFGQSVLVLFGWGAMYFVSGASMLIILGLAAAAVSGGFVAYMFSEHFARRIDAFLSSELDARSQLGYATSAIQEGGLFGLGVGEGQVKWQLPDAHTDFVIAVAAEEYGFMMVLIIITLYAVICLRALSRLTRERDPFIRLAGTGLVAMISAQAMINMGVAVRLLPAKGMTLPFVSQGGSSLLAMGLMVGMLLALTRTRPQGEIGDLMQTRGR
ncbi:FtsW/RodA/SpoVE family cell cycle protein [Pararhodobacter zhoushanensis]|uniref:Probable peptidoglycan glycosyltransferase FtsW n=1 Tax=Pararhodobacter zhoushanensis TaxID=2479545 RepID=A0ABT3H2C4_9RHOB|nr:putative peptidoglycan glycosyltransferase FtsW [Pararhodobacter zhoushanensis]MCW1404366.1 putative lipid II flippase FtsW [Novosphingobium sp. MW5]MCW1933957.1 putative lipid II flippase FtsW [Pararhodobacter zhoushanensis]